MRLMLLTVAAQLLYFKTQLSWELESWTHDCGTDQSRLCLSAREELLNVTFSLISTAFFFIIISKIEVFQYSYVLFAFKQTC